MESKDQNVLRGSIVLAFVLGFALGYKVKEWRIRWLKFRRDRLARKLQDAQKQLDMQAPTI
jgi:hypothetical protein